MEGATSAAGAASGTTPPAEHSTPPVRVLVHEPAAAGALDALPDLPEGELERDWLFRRRPDPRVFAAEHGALVDALRGGGAEVVRLEDVLAGSPAWELTRANPNQVYTRDSAITLPWLPGRYVAGSMRKPIRRPEVEVVTTALRALGLHELWAAPPETVLEGGDVIPFARDGRRTLLVGYGPRTTVAGIDALCEALLPEAFDELLAIRLPDWRMNLDGALVPVTDDVVLVHPESVGAAFLRDASGDRRVDALALLREEGLEPLEVTEEESTALQACNGVALGERRWVCYDLAPRVVAALRDRDVDVRTLPGSALIHGTGGPRCMTRPLYC